MNAKFCSDIGFVVRAASLYCLTVSQVGMGTLNASYNIIPFLMAITSYQTTPFNDQRMISHTFGMWLLITFLLDFYALNIPLPDV